MSKKHFRDCPCTPCGIIISGDLPMCAKHWELVPAAQRDAIFEAKRKGNFRASREATVRAISHVNQEIAANAEQASNPPEPKQPSSFDKHIRPLLGLGILFLILLGQGCMVARYTRLPACACQGTNNLAPGGVRFAVYSCLMNEKAVKISVDKFTGKTHSGITIGAIDSTVDDDALKAIVSAAVETTIKAIIGL